MMRKRPRSPNAPFGLRKESWREGVHPHPSRERGRNGLEFISMIRRRDYLRLTTQKLGLRKKRAAFAIISVALGVVVVVTANSLMEGIRDVAVKTIWTEEIDP